MRKIRLILEYRLSKNVSAEKTALALNLSKGSVINVIRRFNESGLHWPLSSVMADSELEAVLYPASKRLNTTNGEPLPDISYLERELRRPHMTLQRLWEEYRELHPDGISRSKFYRYWKQHRPPKLDMKMIHKGGDKLFVDFSGDGLEYIDRTTGEIISVELFVCSWGASSYSYAESVMTQSSEDFTCAHVRALEYFGVAPHGFVLDNLKAGISKADRYDPIAHSLYEAMARHYGVAVLPTRIKKPKDKAVVESNILHIQRFILARLRNRQFFSLADINTAIREELEEFNTRPMKDYGAQTRKQRFEELDRPFAQKLPVQSFKISRIKTNVRIAPNYHIRFENHYYSVPHHLARRHVDVYQSGMCIEIYHDNVHVCRHKKGPANYGYTTISEHMPPNHGFVKGWSQAWFISQAKKIGPYTAEAVKQIMQKKEHVQQGFNAAMGVLRLARAYTAQRLEAASQRALHFNTVTIRSLKSILEKELDKQNLLPLLNNESVIHHENIRGAHYYQN